MPDAPHPLSLTSRAQALGGLVSGAGYIAWHARARRDPLMHLFTNAGRRRRYVLYRRMHERGPVLRSSTGMQVVTGHAIADKLLRTRAMSVHTRADGILAGVDLSLLELDPPDHTRLRSLVAPAFTPRRMRQQEDRIAGAVDALADRLADQVAQGPVDLMAAFARPLPVLMITALMGVPDDDIEELTRYGDAIGRALDGVQSMRHHREILAANAGLAGLFERLIAERRRDPGDDVVSHLVAAEDAGRVTHDELIALAGLLLIAGFETTVNLIGNAVAALLDRPDLWRRVVDDPSLAERAIDETLRWDSPVQLTGRTPTADLVVDGHRFTPDAGVVVLLGAANRDPAVFEAPDEFSLDRPQPREHLAFSSGIHHCVGRPLAELEARLALAAVVRRLPRLRRAAPETLSPGVVLRGRRTLPVQI